MISWSCIHCDHHEFIEYAGPGIMEKIVCDKCKKISWLRHSNIDPTSYPVELVKVNEETKSVQLLEKLK